MKRFLLTLTIVSVMLSLVSCAQPEMINIQPIKATLSGESFELKGCMMQKDKLYLYGEFINNSTKSACMFHSSFKVVAVQNGIELSKTTWDLPSEGYDSDTTMIEPGHSYMCGYSFRLRDKDNPVTVKINNPFDQTFEKTEIYITDGSKK